MSDVRVEVYSKKGLLKKIQEQYGLRIAWSTLHVYYKKGYLKATYKLQDGKRVIDVYSDQDITYFVELLKTLHQQKGVYLKYVESEASNV